MLRRSLLPGHIWGLGYGGGVIHRPDWQPDRQLHIKVSPGMTGALNQGTGPPSSTTCRDLGQSNSAAAGAPFAQACAENRHRHQVIAWPPDVPYIDLAASCQSQDYCPRHRGEPDRLTAGIAEDTCDQANSASPHRSAARCFRTKLQQPAGDAAESIKRSGSAKRHLGMT